MAWSSLLRRVAISEAMAAAPPTLRVRWGWVVLMGTLELYIQGYGSDGCHCLWTLGAPAAVILGFIRVYHFPVDKRPPSVRPRARSIWLPSVSASRMNVFDCFVRERLHCHVYLGVTSKREARSHICR
ncbi:hypothetical protein LX36DRAFT_374267 [Colletotrichum falcatum]|nr:hypothetical protein LX36DRAFT_374267 [Colletotrichum falcatum]